MQSRAPSPIILSRSCNSSLKCDWYQGWIITPSDWIRHLIYFRFITLFVPRAISGRPLLFV